MTDLIATPNNKEEHTYVHKHMHETHPYSQTYIHRHTYMYNIKISAYKFTYIHIYTNKY